MMKKKLLATLLCLSMAATTFAGATVVSAAEEEHEPVELTIWVTSRTQDDWSLSMEEQFLEASLDHIKQSCKRRRAGK